MQAVLTNNQNKTVLERLDYLLRDVNASNKNDVENSIVQMGAKVCKALVNKLKDLKGLQRGIVAMSLIRIGEDSIEPLKEFASENKDCRWMADYLLSEI